ncbi:MAG TPA: hypothetical protein P5525_11125 [Candidatus Paceibacterota bacterium]|nr:hypothetical protein [Candidatus Paceibacterota bacterium]
MSSYKTTYHRDGTVTVWDVYSQTWRRIAADQVSDQILASLNETERRRIAKMAERARG